MLTKSDTLEKFGAAMAKVQEGIGGAVKGNVNPAFRTKYADLSAVWEAWQAIGPQNGFSVMQFPGEYDADAKKMAMDQIVIHSSGQWVQSVLSIPLSKLDAQAYGSANTYARRYSLAAAVGICPEDDDGNAAVSRPVARHDPAPANDPPAPAPREKLAGPYTSKTALWTAVRAFDRKLRSCGDVYELDALVGLPESQALIEQLERDAPNVARTGEGLPDEFEPIIPLMAKLRTDMLALEENDNAPSTLVAG